MKKMFMLISATAIIAAHVNAGVYYSRQAANPAFPGSGTSWNLERDGSGAAGVSSTYGNPSHDIVFQTNLVMYSTVSTGDLNWSANSYTMENGATLRNRSSEYANFNNGNITVTGATVKFLNGSTAGAGNLAGGVIGTAKLLLGSNTLLLDQSSSASSGIFKFGLDVVGNGTIDLNLSNANCTWLLSNLSTNFTGQIRGDKFSGVVQFAEGNGAINADLYVADNDTRTSRLDLTGEFSVRTLRIEGTVITNGVYTYSDLISFGDGVSKNFADNLIENGGKIYVGMEVIPEPATIGLFIMSSVGLIFYRHAKSR